MQWQTALSGERFEDAYGVMSPDYRAAHSVLVFTEDFGFVGAERLKLDPDCTIRGDASEAWLYPFDDGWFELWNGPEFQLVKVEGEWFLSGERNFYVD